MLRMNDSHHDWQDNKSYIAIFIFIITWLLIVKRWSAIKIGHSVIAIFGCGLMILFDIVTPKEVFNSICGETLLLVTAFMIIHLKLEQGGFVYFLKRVLLYGKPTPLWLLARVSFLSGALAALIMDNGAITFLSPLVFRLCDENRLEIEPFMLALVTSANIGSITTVIGSVKNMIIIESSPEISFFGFFTHMTPLAIIGLVLNTIFLVFYYRKRFIGQTIKSYKPPKTTTVSRDISDLRIIESTYDTDEDAIVAGVISDSDERDESDAESNDDESQHSEGENSNLLARKKPSLHPKPQFANQPDRLSEHVVYMDDNDYDSTSPWVIRRDGHNRDGHNRDAHNRDAHNLNPRQNQPALTRFAWAAPNPESHGLQGLGSNIQKQTERFISDTKIFFGNGDLCKNSFFILLMLGMYVALFFEKSLGWTAITVAALLLLFDGKNATNIINKINWGLIVYLIGMFGIMRGLYTTQLPDLLWYRYEEMFIKPDIPNLSMSILALSLMSILLALTLTSIPAILLIIPYIPNIVDVRLRNNAGYLLAWNVMLVGNLSARRSSTGLIASEIAKDHLVDTPLVQPYEFNIWGKYSVWSTVIISLVGVFVISFFQ